MVDSLQNDLYPPKVIFNDDGTVKNGYGCLTASIERCMLSDHVEYDIQLKHPSGPTWCVTRRYREFRTLRDSLQARYNLPSEGLVPFPPKRYFNNLSPTLVTQRSLDLEAYLNSLLLHYTLPPPPLANFIDWNKYDIHGITNCLARQLTKEGKRILAGRETFVMSVCQVHSINARILSPLCSNFYDKPDEDFSFVVDFISQVKRLKVYGSLEKVYNSNIAVNSLNFDMSPFRNLEYLELNNVDLGRMRGFESIKSTVIHLVVHRSLKNLKNLTLGDLFAAGDGNWVYGENPVSTVPWDHIKIADFSNNFLHSLDQTIALLPNVEILNLSNNLLTELASLTFLSRLRVLYLADNQLYIGEEQNLSPPEVTEQDNDLPEAIVIASASAGTIDSGASHGRVQQVPLQPLRERLGEVQFLVLANNGLRSASIVEGLFSLQHLDLSGNKIELFEELACLGDLPHLNSLELMGNPICNDPYYRRNVLDILGPRFPLIILDGQRVTARECEDVRLHQALLKGGVVCQRSPNVQTSSVKSHNKSADVKAVKATVERVHNSNQNPNLELLNGNSKEPANLAECVEASNGVSADLSEGTIMDKSGGVPSNFPSTQVFFDVEQTATSIDRSEGISMNVSIEVKDSPNTQTSATISEQNNISETVVNDVLSKVVNISSINHGKLVDDDTSLETSVELEHVSSTTEQGVSLIDDSEQKTRNVLVEDTNDFQNLFVSTDSSHISTDLPRSILNEVAPAPPDGSKELSLGDMGKRESLPSCNPELEKIEPLIADKEQPFEEARQLDTSCASDNVDSNFEGKSQHTVSMLSRSKGLNAIHDEISNQFTIQTTVQVVLSDAADSTFTVESLINQPFRAIREEQSVEQIKHATPCSPINKSRFCEESQNVGSAVLESKVKDIIHDITSTSEETSAKAGKHATQAEMPNALGYESNSPNLGDTISTFEI